MISNDKATMNIDGLKVKRFGRNQPHVLFGDIIFLRKMGNEVQFLGELFKKQGHEYRKTPYRIKGKFCDAIVNDDVFATQIWTYSDFPPKNSVCFSTY